jgi:uncharacterized protein (TIGR02145 family)
MLELGWLLRGRTWMKMEFKMRFRYSLMIILFLLSVCFVTQCHRQFTGPDEKTGTMTDIDGNVYRTVKIGSQVWMAENLKVAHYRNGDAIPEVTDSLIWQILTIGACCAYDNSAENVPVYGYLYNWYAINDNRDIAPEGWHVPSDEEWKELEIYLGMSQSEADESGERGTEEGGKLKATGTAYWLYPNIGASDLYGFSALPGGDREHTGRFYGKFSRAMFWSVTESGTYYAVARGLRFHSSGIGRGDMNKISGLSIRLIRD